MTNEDQGCMRKSVETGKIFSAIKKAQEAIICPVKNKTARMKTFSYNYIDLPSILEAIKKPMAENGLSIIQIPITGPQSVGVETTITHSSGEWISGKILLSISENTAQAAGAAITYARRYAVSSMLGMAADDDTDGRTESQRQPIQQPVATTSKPSYRSPEHANNAQPSQTGQPQNNAANRPVSPPVDTSQAQPKQAQTGQQCVMCKNQVTGKVLDYSISYYKKPYCYPCQEDMKQKKKGEQALQQEPGN